MLPLSGVKGIGKDSGVAKPILLNGKVCTGHWWVTGAGSSCHQNASEKLQVFDYKSRQDLRWASGWWKDSQKGQVTFFCTFCTLAGGFKAEQAGDWWHLVLAAVVTEPLVERACQLPGVPALVAFWGDGNLMLTFKKACVGSSAHWQRHFAC